MGTPLGPKYILYNYMDPLGLGLCNFAGDIGGDYRDGDAP